MTKPGTSTSRQLAVECEACSAYTARWMTCSAYVEGEEAISFAACPDCIAEIFGDIVDEQRALLAK